MKDSEVVDNHHRTNDYVSISILEHRGDTADSRLLGLPVQPDRGSLFPGQIDHEPRYKFLQHILERHVSKDTLLIIRSVHLVLRVYLIPNRLRGG
jgi:hypothetical protein